VSIPTLSPTNRKAADKLTEFLAARPVAFIGAGMTQPFYPGWDKLLEGLATHLGVAYDPEMDPLAQAEKFFTGSKDAYKDKLVEIFGTVPGDCRLGLKEMVKLTFRSFITTNYDYSIYRAYQELGPPDPICHLYPDIEPADCDIDRRIFFLHGAVKDNQIADLNNFVLHRTAYNRAYFREVGAGPGLLSSFFYNVFRWYDVLFAGFGLRKDEPLREALGIAHQVASNANLPARRRLMLRPTPIPEDSITSFRLQYGIEVIGYDPLDDRHTGLDHIFAKITEERRFAPPVFTSTLGSIMPPVKSLE